MRGLTRRAGLLGALAAPAVARAQGAGQGAARVVVVGGGFAGATAARALAKAGLRVTLIEADAVYASAPFSNEVLVGLRELGQQQFGWDKLVEAGVKLVQGRVSLVDGTARKVALESGANLEYDRLVLAPGIDLKLDGTLRGYDQAATFRMPHAWKAGIQTVVLREQVQTMADGGTVVLSVPAGPYRGPTAPYERASLIAWFLKQNKPRSKVLVLDAQDEFPARTLFQQAWAALVPGVLEWVPASGGGKVTAVDAAAMTLSCGGVVHKADVANVIPPQQAGVVAQAAGVVDRTGWCPVDPLTFESQRVARIHVIGDAAILGAIPKTAVAAYGEAKACAEAVAALLAGRKPEVPRLLDTAYCRVAPGYAFSVAGVYWPVNGQWAEVEGSGGASPLDAKPEVRAQESAYADAWFKTMTGAVFG